MINKFIDGRTDIILDLLNGEYEATSVDGNGTPLIRWCAYYGDVTAVRVLLSKGADINDLGVNYDLNGAAFHGHWQLVQFLLEVGADPNYALPDTGETALHSCIDVNRPSTNHMIRLLLTYGANPNTRTIPNVETGNFMRDALTKGETPLHRGAAFCNEEGIRLLLDAGADKTIKDSAGETPLSWASWHCRTGRILSLLTYGDHKIHPLHIQNMQSDHGSGWGSGMSIMRMGKVHLDG